MRLRTFLLPVAATSLAASLPAIAATPESGTVSNDSPTVKWEGTAPGYGVFPTNLLLTGSGNDPAPCEAPYCDTFALKVADKADLNVTAMTRTADNFTELRVIKPDGEMVFVQSGQGDAARAKVKAAAPGDYTVQVITNDPAVPGAGGYDADAKLMVAGQPASGGSPTQPADPPPPNPGAPPNPAPQPTPQQPPPSSSQQPAAALGLKTRKLSARKAKKRFKLVVTSSKPVTDFRMVVKKGKKIVSRGKLKTLNGKASVRLKVKK